MKTPTVLKDMSARTQKRILWAIATLLVMAVIFVFSSQASGQSEDLSDAFAGLLNVEQAEMGTRLSNQSLFFGLTLRKLAHIFLFAALGFCACEALAGMKRRAVWAVAIGYLYAILDEIHQSFSRRHGRWQDTLIDLIGVALGVGVALLLPRLNQVFKKWFYDEWDDRHPTARRRLEWCLDALSLAAVMQYVGYRFLQTTMFPFIYSELYKTATFLSLVVFGGVRFAYLFARRQWAEADEKAKTKRFLKFVGTCFLALPFFLVAFLHDYKMLIFIPICWMCLYDMRAETVFKWYVRVIGVMLAATVLCCLAGVVLNIYRGRHHGSYGIINTTDFAAYFLFLILFLWCRTERRNWQTSAIFAVSFVATGIVVDILTGSMTTKVCCFLTAIACTGECISHIIYAKHGRPKKLIRIIDCISCLVFPLALVSFVVLVELYGAGLSFATRINAMLSGRLSTTLETYQKYGIHMLGTAFTMHGVGGSLFGSGMTYDFLDNSYAYLLIRYGVMITLIVMCLWEREVHHAIKDGKRRIAISMSIIAIYAMSESHFVDISYNIFLVLPFCNSSVQNIESAVSTAQKRGENTNKYRVLSVASRIGIIGVVCYAFPYILSWLRTFFYFKEWSSGTDTLFALLFCVLLILSVCAIWNTVPLLFGRRKHFVLVLPMTALMLFFMFFEMYSFIHAEINASSDELTEEEGTIQIILDSATQPVYALERSELYLQSFPGFSKLCTTADDLSRDMRGSVITAKSRELLILTLQGGKYLQFSSNSGIYSFDENVIEALTDAGFKWEDYYYSERTCDLNDLAELNHLKQNGDGSLILSGNNDSLMENRFMDQYSGDYEVRYTLRFAEDTVGLADDDTICTLVVSGNKGESELVRREVSKQELDHGEGEAITLLYHSPFMARMEYLIYVVDGVTLYVDEIAWRRVA